MVLILGFEGWNERGKIGGGKKLRISILYKSNGIIGDLKTQLHGFQIDIKGK